MKKKNHESKSSDFGCKTLGIEAFFIYRIHKIRLSSALNKPVQIKIGKGSEKVGIICVKST